MSDWKRRVCMALYQVTYSLCMLFYGWSVRLAAGAGLRIVATWDVSLLRGERER